VLPIETLSPQWRSQTTVKTLHHEDPVGGDSQLTETAPQSVQLKRFPGPADATTKSVQLKPLSGPADAMTKRRTLRVRNNDIQDPTRPSKCTRSDNQPVVPGPSKRQSTVTISKHLDQVLNPTSYLDDPSLTSKRAARTQPIQTPQSRTDSPTHPDPTSADNVTPTKTRVSERRNESRIAEAKDRDEEILGKSPSSVTHFPSSVEDILGPPIVGPDNAFTPPSWLLEAIKNLVDKPVPIPRKPPIMFEATPEALLHNVNLFKEHDYDFESFVAANMDMTIGYNSEFRPIGQIRHLLVETTEASRSLKK
jgi:hypothetical protein